ncbi:MAG: tRNA pseudouridine(38-40) synthase TruA [bacterium]|nr:tRNA pseudouridine(38-40) synthase TruA [bacterium]
MSILSHLPEHPAAVADRLIKTAQRFRYRIDLQYDGTEFSGMQWQPDRRTVQQCVEEALEPLFESFVRLIPSSRTDAGVHAAQQVAHFDVPVKRAPHAIVRACNSTMPQDVRIVTAEERDETFHARFSARWRGYEYRVSQVPVALGRQYVWQYFQPTKIETLEMLAQQIIGTHSFLSFAHENPIERHGYECTVFHSSWTTRGPLFVYEIQASRFLHGMVRMLVGTMIDIASGRGSAKSIAEVLAAHDNRLAGTKAPANGLTLMRVGYNDWTGAENRRPLN